MSRKSIGASQVFFFFLIIYDPETTEKTMDVSDFLVAGNFYTLQVYAVSAFDTTIASAYWRFEVE